jgi:M6 family metalloprotease-like protein
MKLQSILTLTLLFILVNEMSAIRPPRPGVIPSPQVIKEFQEIQKDYNTGYWAEKIDARYKLLQENPELFHTQKELFVDSIYAPTLLGYFTDLPPVYTNTQFQALLWDGPNPTGTVTDYYREVSYGKMHLSGYCENWSPVLGPVANYNPGTSAGGRRFVWELLHSSDPHVDFSKYVQTIDGSGNGHVPFLVVIHTGGDAAAGAPNIWSHRSDFSGTYGKFYTNDTLPNGKQVIVDGPYAIQPEMTGNTNYGGQIEPIGVFAHELGHIFNIPDLYDVSGQGEGIGGWCLMAAGSYGGDQRNSAKPSHMSAWCKEKMGWVVPAVVTTDLNNQFLQPVEWTQQIYKLWRNGVPGQQYFLIENRQKTGFDVSLLESGLLIFHVDNTVAIQNNPNRYKVDLEQADGMRHLNLKTNRGDAGDPFPGTGGANNPNRLFDGYSTPNSKDYSNLTTGVNVGNIRKVDTLILANISVWDTAFVAPAFTNVTTTAGVSDSSESFGVSAVDYDNDGWTDIYVTNKTSNRLYKNNGDDTFTNTAVAAGVADTDINRSGIWGDYDNDGFNDLYVTTYNTVILTKKNKLYKNNGDGTFTNQTTSDLSYADKSMGAAFADYNNDGYIDVFITVDIYKSRLYKNNGDGSFTLDTLSGINYKARGNSATWGDYNNDGFPDLYIVTREETKPSTLWKNNGDGTFTDVTSIAGVGNFSIGSGAAWGDFDNDGYFDLAVCNEGGENRLYKNNGNSTFTDVASSVSVSDGGINYSPVWVDYDLDGYLDLYIARSGPNRLFKNLGNGTFTEIAGRMGISTSAATLGASVLDFNNDGFPDIYLGSSSATISNVLYCHAGSGNRWLKISVTGTVSNRNAVGTKITVVSGGLRQIREINAGTGYMSQNSYTQFFGFGTVATVDSLIIRFPSGRIYKMANVATNQHLIIDESKVSVNEIAEVPDKFHVWQNYPNPFNPVTVIDYQLPTDNYITLKVYNVIGQEVATLVDGVKEAGFHSVSFDATSASGGLPSGVLFYRLHAGKYKTVKKMLLVK